MVGQGEKPSPGGGHQDELNKGDASQGHFDPMQNRCLLQGISPVIHIADDGERLLPGGIAGLPVDPEGGQGR